MCQYPLASFSGFACYVEPGVHVGRSPEIPRKRWAFELPDIPDAVVAEIVLLEERQTQFVDPAVAREALANFLGIVRAKRPEHHFQELTHHRLLLAVEVGDRESGRRKFVAFQRRGLRFVGLGFRDQRPGLFLVVQCAKDLVGLIALIPPDVVGVLRVLGIVAIGSMAVEDRPAESGSFNAVAIGAQCVVTTREYPLERLVESRARRKPPRGTRRTRRRRLPFAS